MSQDKDMRNSCNIKPAFTNEEFFYIKFNLAEFSILVHNECKNICLFLKNNDKISISFYYYNVFKNFKIEIYYFIR